MKSPVQCAMTCCWATRFFITSHSVIAFGLLDDDDVLIPTVMTTIELTLWFWRRFFFFERSCLTCDHASA
jgi:hypothetical protein